MKMTLKLFSQITILIVSHKAITPASLFDIVMPGSKDMLAYLWDLKVNQKWAIDYNSKLGVKLYKCKKLPK